MNVLIRMDNLHGRKRIESCLPEVSASLYYVRSDSAISRTLELIRVDAAILGVYMNDGTVFDSLKLLRSNMSADSPIICCCSRAPTIKASVKGLELACLSLGAAQFFDEQAFYSEKFAITLKDIFSRNDSIGSTV